MLSKLQIHQFFQDGYIGPFDLPQDFLQPYTEKRFKESVFAYFRARSECGDTAFSDSLRNQHRYSKSLCALASEPGLLSRVTSILGPDLLLWLGHIAPRLPGDRGQAFHVDSDNRNVRGLHVTAALSPNTASNGCLQVIPGSHLFRASLCAASTRGLVDLWDQASVMKYADLVAPWSAPHQLVPMTLEVGQYFLMSEGTWHFVGPNDSRSFRLNLVSRYARPDIVCRDYGFSDSEIHSGPTLPCVLVAGSDQFLLNNLVSTPTDDIFRLPNPSSA